MAEKVNHIRKPINMKMRKIRCAFLWVFLCVFFAGCASERGTVESEEAENEVMIVPETESIQDDVGTVEREVDHSIEFGGIQGCAVVYSPKSDEYLLYNRVLCDEQVSPLSSFKIISTLIGLDAGVIDDDTSVMQYDGTIYPVEAWNGELTLEEAFHSSCVWYFRQVIDHVGQDAVQGVLDELDYGNCDISQWEGSGINPLPDLNGFWIASSLEISPREQVEVLAKLFEGETNFEQSDIEILKTVMMIEKNGDRIFYGKTGSDADGHAWFTGFAEQSEQRTYIAVYLNDVDHADKVTGNKAKEIAAAILEME